MPSIAVKNLGNCVEIKYRKSGPVPKLFPDPGKRTSSLVTATETKSVENQYWVLCVKLLSADLGSGGTIMEDMFYHELP